MATETVGRENTERVLTSKIVAIVRGPTTDFRIKDPTTNKEIRNTKISDKAIKRILVHTMTIKRETTIKVGTSNKTKHRMACGTMWTTRQPNLNWVESLTEEYPRIRMKDIRNSKVMTSRQTPKTRITSKCMKVNRNLTAEIGFLSNRGTHCQSINSHYRSPRLFNQTSLKGSKERKRRKSPTSMSSSTKRSWT